MVSNGTTLLGYFPSGPYVPWHFAQCRENTTTGQLIMEAMKIQGRITKADVGFAGHGAAVTEKAIVPQALAKRTRGDMNAHRQPAVLVGRRMQAIAVPKSRTIVRGF